MIKSTVDTAFQAGVFSLKRGFGYVDNQFRGKEPYTTPDNPYTNEVENSGGDAFDISWAVDEYGNYIDLDKVNFIKVHTGVMDGAGWLGQISTEIMGAVDVAPDKSIHGENELLVIREIPLQLDTTEYQLEVFAFDNGRIKPDEAVQWTVNMTEASVDEYNILHVNRSGELTLTATLLSNQKISSSVSTTIDLTVSSQKSSITDELQMTIFPNPAKDYIQIQSVKLEMVRIIDVTGKLILQEKVDSENQLINIESLSNGIYIIHTIHQTGTSSGKFIKE
jgi:hypothetical protein